MRFVLSVLGTAVGAGLLLGAMVLQARPADEGAELFKGKCAMCHGPEGKGFPSVKTPDFTDPKWQASIKDSQITATIKNGKKGTAMPPFEGKLKDDEIKELVTFIRSLGAKK